MTVHSATRNVPGMYQECTRNIPGIYQESLYKPRNAPGILVGSTRNVPGMHQECTRISGMEPGLPGILQEHVGQWKVLRNGYQHGRDSEVRTSPRHAKIGYQTNHH